MPTRLGATVVAISDSHLFRAGKVTLGVSVALLIAGCSSLPADERAMVVADPATPVGAVGYRSTIGPYTSLRPVDPAPWRELNDRVAPAPKRR
jgi:hypothetical protein